MVSPFYVLAFGALFPSEKITHDISCCSKYIKEFASKNFKHVLKNLLTKGSFCPYFLKFIDRF